VLVTAGVVAGILALLGVFNAPHTKKAFRQTSFVFDSLYEDRRAESFVSEEVLAREMAAEEKGGAEESEQNPDLGGKTELKSEKCSISPPPPYSTRMICRAFIEIEEKHEKSKPTRRINGWNAEVLVNPQTGQLKLHLTRLNTEA